MDRDLAVLVVDDDADAREFEREALAAAGYQVRTATGGSEALEMLEGGAFDAVLLDVRMPGMDGLEVIRRYRASGGRAPIVVLSALAGSDDVVRAMRLGASDYLTKPVEPAELVGCTARALGQAPPVETAVEPVAASPAVPEAPPHVVEASDEDLDERAFISLSPSMARVKALIDRIADTDVPVLLLGESGVGKEVIAREIHRRSRRRTRPFLKINCAALPSELLESELFGHERGAFTGATAEKPGKFELADKGSIFLDEIGEMAIRLQAKLLQVLQDEEFFRVGGTTSVRVDARVVCATNRDLEKEIAVGNFREDLFYRLNVVCIRIPPLRERKEDIPPIFDYFVRKYRRRYNCPEEPFSAELMRELMNYDFPGNVRELETRVRRLVVLRDPQGVLRELTNRPSRELPPAQPEPQATNVIQQPPVPANVLAAPNGEDVSLKDIARHAAMLAEREAILNMLARTAWNKRKAAARLKISYKALLYKIKECGIVDPRQLMSVQ